MDVGCPARLRTFILSTAPMSQTHDPRERRRPTTAVNRLAVGVVAALVVIGACSTSEGVDEAVRQAAMLDPLNPAVWIPGGDVHTGSDDWDAEYPAGSPYSKVDEDPQRWTVEGFWLQTHEVTHAEYARFDSTHVVPEGEALRPVVDVTWPEAMAYARSLGGSLPSEVHWEYAARGAERRLYPWGDDEPDCRRAHYRECEPRTSLDVGSRPADVTPEGVVDLAGNVREWVIPPWFDPARHPANPDAMRLKGGSFAHPAFFLRAASVTNRLAAFQRFDNVGFRVAWGTGPLTR